MDFNICDHKAGFPKYSHIYRKTIGVDVQKFTGYYLSQICLSPLHIHLLYMYVWMMMQENGAKGDNMNLGHKNTL